MSLWVMFGIGVVVGFGLGVAFARWVFVWPRDRRL